MAETYRLVREIPVDREYDLVVAGGGPAGSAAAVCAARLGANVLLVEQMGCLGGMGTSGLVNAFDPMADGEKMLVGGFMRELVETLYERGFVPEHVLPDTWRKDYHRWTRFKGEGLKLLLDEMAADAGVEVRFFTRVIDADAEPDRERVKGVVVQNIEGYRYVPAGAFIDATGDAVLSALCGADYREAGRDTEQIMPATLASLHANVDWQKLEESGVNMYEEYRRALDNGEFTQYDRHLPGMSRVSDAVGYLNGGHIFGLNACECRSLSDGMARGRRIVREFVEFFRRHIPGCEDLDCVATGALMGVRESRRIVGEYELTIDDYLARRQFPDQIGVYNKFVDIHIYDCSEEEWERHRRERDETGRLQPGECHGIPYGILVPRGWRNLWVAGRCNSSDVKVHGSIRVMPAAAMMGQAAGTAAVQSLVTGQPANDLDTARLVTTLRENGAYLPQPELSREMTRKTAAEQTGK